MYINEFWSTDLVVLWEIQDVADIDSDKQWQLINNI